MKRRHYLTETDLVEIRRMIEVERLQMWKVAENIGVNIATIQKTCKKLGLKTQRSGPRSGEGHTNWKGGRVLTKGYWQIYCPGHPSARRWNHYIAEHRLVMEQKLGRYLLRSEVVHHIDGNPLNNSPENLIVFGSNKEHLKAELTGRCPNWTAEGKKKIADGVAKIRKYSGTPKERARQAWQQYEKNHPHRKRGVRQQPQPSDHPTT